MGKLFWGGQTSLKVKQNPRRKPLKYILMFWNKTAVVKILRKGKFCGLPSFYFKVTSQNLNLFVQRWGRCLQFRVQKIDQERALSSIYVSIRPTLRALSSICVNICPTLRALSLFSCNYFFSTERGRCVPGNRACALHNLRKHVVCSHDGFNIKMFSSQKTGK